MNAAPMLSGSALGASSLCRFSQSPTMRWERSAMSAMERPSCTGSATRPPGAALSGGASAVVRHERPSRRVRAPLDKRRRLGSITDLCTRFVGSEIGGRRCCGKRRRPVHALPSSRGWRAVAGARRSMPASDLYPRPGRRPDRGAAAAAARCADAPYPSVGSIPQRPGAPDVLAQQRIADQLATQRDAATTAAEEQPADGAAARTPATPKPPADAGPERQPGGGGAAPPAPPRRRRRRPP